jgi:hypothetical protein
MKWASYSSRPVQLERPSQEDISENEYTEYSPWGKLLSTLWEQMGNYRANISYQPSIDSRLSPCGGSNGRAAIKDAQCSVALYQELGTWRVIFEFADTYLSEVNVQVVRVQQQPFAV